MKLNKTLFCLAVLCISTALANYRHIPDRAKMFSEESHANFMPFLRNLADNDLNSQNTTSTSDKSEPVTVRLQGNTDLGYYYVTLFFGTPVQKQTLIVDTGSVTTTIPCTECGSECGKNHFDKPFNHKTSKTFEEFKCEEAFGSYSCFDCTNQCPFSVSYVEGSSYSGHFNKDFVVFGNEIEDNYALLKQKAKAHHNSTGTTQNSTETPDANEETYQRVMDIVDNRKIFMPFGCTNKETKLFYDQEADGILGLGVNTDTQSNPPNLLDARNLHNESFSKAFSLCYAQEGGYFTIGGHNSAYHAHDEQIQYTRYSDAFGQYKVFLHQIQVDGKDIGVKPAELNSGEGAFFDSGTTLTHVPKKTYDGIRGHLNDYCQSDESKCGKNAQSGVYCWNYKPAEFASLKEFYATFPTINFTFGREDHANYEWRPEDYLHEKDEEKRLYCLGLSHYERESILGGTFMKNHDVLFDKENKRLGFIRANCNGVQDVNAPIYKENNSTGPGTVKDTKQNTTVEVTQPNQPIEQTPTDVVQYKVDHPETDTLKTAIMMCLIGAAMSVVVGLGVFIYRICRKKTPYQNLRNLRIEIPAAGLSIHRLDSSGMDTPQASQPRQDEKTDNNGTEPAVPEDQNSPQIEIDVEDM